MNSLTQIWQLIKADYVRYYPKSQPSPFKIITNAIFAINHAFAFNFWLRLGGGRRFLKYIALFMWYRFSRKYHIEIPIDTVIGPGLYLGHGYGIVVNHKTRIGKNCSLSHFVSIGSNHQTPAVIGDNCWIGPHVSIVENVKIGNNVKIGAGTVVIHDIPDNSTSVGNPNRIINSKLT